MTVLLYKFVKILLNRGIFVIKPVGPGLTDVPARIAAIIYC
jgi:hypothetical protein